MSKMSHINVIEKYEDHKMEISHLLSSILSCFADAKMFEQDHEELRSQLNALCEYYPFISLLYLLDPKGKQVGMNIPGRNFNYSGKVGHGIDRSRRPYYLLARDSDQIAITDPYLSSVCRELCLSACIKIHADDGSIQGFIVLDIDLGRTLSFLTGDSKRIYFEPFFKTIYTLIVIGLFSSALLLLFLAARECWSLLTTLMSTGNGKALPFGVVIYLTLGLAIFDLGKTTLEEEVLLYKDILHHSSTRRTITRFIAAIIIAVSIEALLVLFKSVLNHNSELIIQAVWIILAAGFLLISLAVYVFLGSKAELVLQHKKQKKRL